MEKIKIFLVEDEFVIREGIKNSIDWENQGFLFCGEAADGELALPLIKKLKPEIVITDIRMPFMDGLELSKIIKKELPHTEIIILTGYEEFEYAKECIRIGVSEYMLKPVNREELLEKLNSLSDIIYEHRKDEELRERYTKEVDAYFSGERKGLFHELVTGGRSTPELLSLAEKLEIDLTAVCYNLLLFKMRPADGKQDDESEETTELWEKISGFADREYIITFERNIEGKAYLLKADSEEEMQERKELFIQELTDLLEKRPEIRYFGGVGHPVMRLSELSSCFEEASRAFAHRYLIKENVILESSNLIEPSSAENEKLELDAVDPKKIDRERLCDFLRFGSPEETVFFVEEFFREFSDTAMESMMFRQYISMDSYFTAVDYLEDLGIPKEEMESMKLEMGFLETEKGAKQYIVQMLNEAFALRDGSKTSKYKDVIEKVVRYVEEHYKDAELSLNSVAAYVNFSPNHFSAVFSQEYGQTFIKYLTDYRIGKAKELLRRTQKKSSDICFEVGYKDPHYFSYLFKKTQGLTPTQYREGKEEEV